MPAEVERWPFRTDAGRLGGFRKDWIVDVTDDTAAFLDLCLLAALAEGIPEIFASRVNLGRTGSPGRMSRGDLFVHDTPQSPDL